MITQKNLYNHSGTFGMTFKGTAAEIAAIPAPLWVLEEGDLWYDTTNDVWKTYSGSAWVDTVLGTGDIPDISGTYQTVAGTTGWPLSTHEGAAILG